jgi:hypothetical protein
MISIHCSIYQLKLFFMFKDGVMAKFISIVISIQKHLNFSPCICKKSAGGGACGKHGRGEKSVQGLGGKAGRKETTWKTKA